MWAELLVFGYAVIAIWCLAIFVALVGRRPLKVRSGLAMFPACALLMFGAIFQLTFTDYNSLIIIYYINALLFVLIFTSFTVFVGEFTNVYDPYSRTNKILISIMPILITFAIITDPWLHLYNLSYEIRWFSGEVAYLGFTGATLHVVGIIYCLILGLIFNFIVISKLYKEKYGVVLFCFIIGIGACYILSVLSIFYVDLTVVPSSGLSLTIAVIIFYTAALVFGLFNITPVARKKILDVIEDAILILDSQGSLVDLNTTAVNITGERRKDIINKAPDRILTKLPGLGRLINGPEPASNIEMISDNGRIFDVRMIPFAYDMMGRTGRMLVMRDITESKQAAERIREAETQVKLAEIDRRYKVLVDNLTEIIITFDAEGRITFSNLAFKKVFGKIGRLINEDNISNVLSEKERILLRNSFRNATPDNSEFDFEHVLTLIDGSDLWICWKCKVIFDPDGKLIAILAAGVDITEIKRSEEEYRAVVESQKEMIVRRSKDGVINFVNKAYSNFFQIPVEDLIAHDYFPSLAESDIAQIAKVVSSLTPERPDYDSLVFKVTLKNDTVRSIEWKIRGIFDSSSHLVEYQSVGNDITDKMMMEEELVKSQKLESIGLLAGGIAHDFNNFLSSIVSNIEVAAKDDQTGDRARHRLGEAVRSAMNARHLTQQLLTFSKGGKPVKEATDVAELLRANIEFTLTGSNVMAEYLIEEDLRPVAADPFQLGQVINNIVINALQSMPEGGHIIVEASMADPPGLPNIPADRTDQVRISITDSGVGISEGDMTRIFDPFFTTKEKGTGLGLTTVQSIIKNHGGSLKVRSSLGSGTTFSIYLPACSPTDIVPKDGAKGDVTLEQSRILIMDDDESILDVLSEIMRDMGHEVKLARNGEEAIEAVAKSISEGRPFNGAIMDLTIKGGMCGKDAIKHLLNLDPRIKAIVSSGYSNDPVMADPKRYGFIDILRKPYTIQELTEKLSTILRKY